MVLKLGVTLGGKNKDSECLRTNDGITCGPTTDE